MTSIRQVRPANVIAADHERLVGGLLVRVRGIDLLDQENNSSRMSKPPNSHGGHLRALQGHNMVLQGRVWRRCEYSVR